MLMALRKHLLAHKLGVGEESVFGNEPTCKDAAHNFSIRIKARHINLIEQPSERSPRFSDSWFVSL
jgi:hypothetical protein